MLAFLLGRHPKGASNSKMDSKILGILPSWKPKTSLGTQGSVVFINNSKAPSLLNIDSRDIVDESNINFSVKVRVDLQGGFHQG